MRALPLAFIRSRHVMLRIAVANADTTHPHPKARSASVLVALTGSLLLRNQCPDLKLVISAVLKEYATSCLVTSHIRC